MLVFDINIQGKKRDQLTRTEWLKIAHHINRMQPPVIELRPGVKAPRITRPTDWNGQEVAMVKPFMRPYCVELERTSPTSYAVRIHKLKWNGYVIPIHEITTLTAEGAMEYADKFLKIINQNWPNVVAKIAMDIGAVDFMVDSSLNYVKFRFTTPDEASMDKRNAIHARRAMESAFLPCMVKFSNNIWRGDKEVEEVKVVLR